jgi:hypothetical protein
MRRAWVGAWAITAALLLVPAAAGAATFTVNTTDDPMTTGCPDVNGQCSFRNAVAASDGNGQNDSIVFSLPSGSTITLTQGEVNAGTNGEELVIAGPGANQLTIKGGNSQPVLGFNNNGTSTLSGVTITGGEAQSLTAAGINNRSGTVTLDGVVVTGNHNDALGVQGAGGVLNDDVMTIRRSTISNNVVDDAGTGGGGGVVSHPGSILIVNTTISGNTVNSPPASNSTMGGGLWNAFGSDTMTLVNVTVSNNKAEAGAGGLLNEGTANLSNTLLAGNSGGEADCDNASGGSTTSQGYNLVGNDSGCNIAAQSGDKLGSPASPINPVLGGLAQNGGPTPTMALLQGSPAINGGNPNGVSDTEPPADPPSLVSCRTTDQRGIVRPQLGVCDIGAYEYAPGVALAEVSACSTSGQVPITFTPPQGGFAQAVHYQIDNGPEQRQPTENNVAVVTVPPGRHTLIYWAESQGGDQELSEHTATVLVDNTGPTVQITSDQRKTTYRRGSKGSITIKATDSLSPLTRNPSKRHRKISTARLGRHTLGFTAEDSCGNKTTRTFRYRVVAAARKPVRRRGSTSPRFTG